jgi:hypothetical protein
MYVHSVAALITIVAGALAGAAASLGVNELRDWWRLQRATDGIDVEEEGRAGSRVTARVKNSSNYCIHDATAYVTIQHGHEDVLSPPRPFRAYLWPEYRKKLTQDRLCWAVKAPTPNPVSVDIFPREEQVLDVADFGANSEWVEIPSEVGYSSSQTAADVERVESKGGQRISSRIFLKSGKKYCGTIKIVSANTKARAFEIEIDPSDTEKPLRVLSGRRPR